MNEPTSEPAELQGETDFFVAEYFVSHTLPDTPFCRALVLPAIESVVPRNFNQYVFMDLENFGRSSVRDGKNADLFAKAYAKDIDRLLAQSRYFLLVASQAALLSSWVRREVSWWFTNRHGTEMFVVHREACDLDALHVEASTCTSFSSGDDTASEASRLALVLRTFQSRHTSRGDA